MSRQAVILTLLATLMCGAVFALWPELDLEVARLFLRDGAFAGSGASARALRWLLYVLPSAALGGAALMWLAGRLGGRRFLFLVLSMALGPGLLVNVILKDHWHRPRPVQTMEFGGPDPFRPWYRFDGACEKNCSFVSGETSAAAWLVAPASLAPPPLQLPAIVLALGVAAATGATRMAFGGHYLSDVLFAILFSLLVAQGLARLLHRTETTPPKDEPPLP
ncbi:MAG: Membrane-associated enzyme (Acid phosphatase) superfamily [Rhodospirillales bacterium]|nr:Membrane-associated enzyme (Acid phosphatase) superfamily [Rhodospirillales bacterium]